VIAWLLAAMVAFAPQDARDTPAQRGGSSEIRGVIVTADSAHTPVRHALVTLTGSSPITTISDDAGGFVFAAISEGRYQLTAGKPGFVTTAYGGVTDDDRGVTIVVAAGQRLAVQVALPRGAVITGALTGPSGEPLGGVPVTASRFSGARAQQLIDRGRAVSDDDGVFRIYGLPEGRFVVTAWPNGVKARESLTAPFPPTSHPNVLNAADALVVAVSAGEERAGIDIALRPAPTVTVSGQVLDADGRRADGVRVALVPDATPMRIRMSVDDATPMELMTGADGQFVFPKVTGGSYTILATQGGRAAASTPAEPIEWARADVLIDGRDQTGVSLQLHRGTTVSGRAVLDLAAPRGTREFTVTLTGDPRFGLDSAEAVIGEDGSWSVDGVVPGRYDVVATGREELPITIEVGSEPVTGVSVTATDKIGGARGRLTDAAGAAAMGYLVIVFPADRARWPNAVTRLPDTNGDWEIETLLAGEYRVAAIAATPLDGLINTALLDALVPASATVTVTTSAIATINLRVGGT
jgi:hypothetical protein